MNKTFYLLGGVLCSAIAFAVLGTSRCPQPSFHGSLLDVLADNTSAGSWSRTLQPIADTPEMKEAVGELLSYDDGVFAIYTQRSRRISVYLAYWTPGRMSHRLVATHTPDVCWVGGGWKRVDGGTWTGATAERSEIGGQRSEVSGGLELTSGVRPLSSGSVQPGEWRTFVMNGQTEHVVFWHLVGGKSKSYGTGYAPPWYSPLLDLWEKGLNQREEQFFVRISSNEPIEAIWNEPIVQQVVSRVPGLALPVDGSR